ncbi:MAG: decaprenyl-phosphate phosphoribosyltransferase [Myxococcales bacterium]|nr:MAG: decaprenyl-phosphate phosphoribosyltransferase [Myxococcales bacterium]
MLKSLVVSLRPKQWVKNLILYAPLVFSRNFFEWNQTLKVTLGVGVFCLLAGSVYLLNDIVDREKDRLHPLKSKRPLASGALSAKTAWAAFFLLAGAGAAAGFASGTLFGVLALGYFALNVAYSFYLKHVVIIDVMVIAIGFVMRVLAGAAIIEVPATPWLLMCTILLALFLGFAKRRHELVLLNDSADGHRRVLEHYTPYFLDQMMPVVSAATVMSYALYTISPETVAHFGTSKLIYTIPFVLYGIFRYLYLVHLREQGGSPTHAFLSDKPLLINVLLWLAACILIIEGTI